MQTTIGLTTCAIGLNDKSDSPDNGYSTRGTVHYYSTLLLLLLLLLLFSVTLMLVFLLLLFVLGTVKTTDTASSNGRSTRGVVHYHS